MLQRLAILTEGRCNPISAKTAVSLMLYRRPECIALIDTQTAGTTAQQPLGFGGDVPIVASLSEVFEKLGGADTLAIGVAPAGGKLPPAMRNTVLEAARRGMTIVSGLHSFLSNDTEITAAANSGGATIHDVRKNDEADVADRLGLNDTCLRIHTVGQDCSCGKMMTSTELVIELQKRGHDAKFVPTGQTGIMVAPGINANLPKHKLLPGELDDLTAGGTPIDCVVADFINGAAEKLVKRNQHHDIIVIEGQATLVHPSYSSVTYGLLHGTLPHGLIMCYEAKRPHMVGREHIPLMPLDKIIKLYEHAANIEIDNHCKFIGVALNSRLMKGDQQAIEDEVKYIEDTLQLPCCDPIYHGPAKLADAVMKLKAERGF
jgi:uncharacterized NAD-dependent epimerase/dehydratase family protein